MRVRLRIERLRANDGFGVFGLFVFSLCFCVWVSLYTHNKKRVLIQIDLCLLGVGGVVFGDFD